MGLDGLLGLLDVSAQVDIPNIHIDPGGAPGAFALDHVRALVHLDVRHLLHGHLAPAGGGDEQAPQGRQIFAEVLKIPQIYRVAFQALHRLGQVFPAHGAGNDILHLPDGEAVAGRFPAVDFEVQIIAAEWCAPQRRWRFPARFSRWLRPLLPGG